MELLKKLQSKDWLKGRLAQRVSDAWEVVGIVIMGKAQDETHVLAMVTCTVNPSDLNVINLHFA